MHTWFWDWRRKNRKPKEGLVAAAHSLQATERRLEEAEELKKISEIAKDPHRNLLREMRQEDHVTPVLFPRRRPERRTP